jgi:phage gp45-like
MKLNVGDKVIWIDDDNKQKITRGKVVNVSHGIVINWDNGRTINYSLEQIRNMKEGHYSGYMILDCQSIRQDKLESLGI